jgi:hypothetical protein
MSKQHRRRRAAMFQAVTPLHDEMVPIDAPEHDEAAAEHRRREIEIDDDDAPLTSEEGEQ